MDHTLSYTDINSTLLESIRRICGAAKDLDKHINIECPDLTTLPTNDWPVDNFDEVLELVQAHFPERISAVIQHGQNINTSACSTLEDKRLRLDISTKLAVLGNVVQDMVNYYSSYNYPL